MSNFFLTILNMSISASWLLLAVLLLRLILKKAPKWVAVLLWGIVALRLICPFAIESPLSLIPSAETVSPQIMMDRTPQIDSGVPVINSAINPAISGSLSPAPGTSMNPLQLWIPLVAILWLAGVAAMLIYMAVSYYRVKKKVRAAILLRDNIFQSEQVVSPFVLGLIKPKIYLPFHIDEQDMPHVIAHEQAHIERKDHWWKPLGFALLAVHWFNPLMWLGYILLCRDIELACDEKVVKEMDSCEKADYSQALLSCSVSRRAITACPLAFGEVGVKKRVKSVLRYKKPAFWIIVTAIILLSVVAVCFLTNPTTGVDAEMSEFIEAQILDHHRGMYAHGEYCCADFQVLGKQKSKDTTTVYMWVLYKEYDQANGQIESVSGAHIPTAITVKKTDGEYALVEYWEPRDGMYYPEDIKAKFPWYLQLQALDSQRYIKRQNENCLRAATEYFKEDISGLSWTYSPMLSATFHSFYDFDFMLAYTHVEATCTNGILKDLWAEGQPEGQTLRFDQGRLVSWSPNDAVIENIPNISRVSFTVYNEEEKLYSATVAVTCVQKKAGSARFVINQEEADGIVMIRNGETACFVEEDTISPIGGADDSQVTVTEGLTLKEAPNLMVFSAGQSIAASRGTTSWMYKQPDGTAVAVCGDSSHPLTRIDSMAVLDLHPLYTQLNAHIQFQAYQDGNALSLVNPDKMTVRCWPETQWHSSDPESEDVSTMVNSGNLFLTLKDGNYVYEVTATWERDSYEGTATYCFRTNKASQIHYPMIAAGSKVILQCDKTPTDQIQKAYDNEEFVITVSHCQMDDGLWVAENNAYLYRLEITGRMHDAAKNTTYIVLSNTKDITFDQVWKASGYSSNSADYFDPQDAIIVGHKMFS